MPVLVSLLHVGPQSATSASLVIVGLTSVIAAIPHARGSRVRWSVAAVVGVVGSITALGGSILNRAVDPRVLLIAFSGLMVVGAVAMLRRTTAAVAAPIPLASTSTGDVGRRPRHP